MRQVGERHDQDAPIETSPLRAPASNGVSHVAARPRPDLLLLRPTRGFPVLGAALGAILLAAGAVIYLTSRHPAGLFVGAIGAVFTAAFAGILLFALRAAFDRATGTWAVRRFGVHQGPLGAVRAVQLVPGGWHGGPNQPQFHTYQCNLVLAGAVRVNLTNMANWPATWSVASQVADFLDVPLLDTVSED